MLKHIYQTAILLTIFVSFSISTSNKNVFNNILQICSVSPMTGFERTGKCETNEFDQGNEL
jgi:uncharacterized protein (DUF2237 family)